MGLNLRDEQNVDSSDEFKGFEVEGIFRMPFSDAGTVQAEVEVNEFHAGQLTFTGFKRGGEAQEFTAGFGRNDLHGLGLMLIEAADRIERNRREALAVKFKSCMSVDGQARATKAAHLWLAIEDAMDAEGANLSFAEACESIACLDVTAGLFMRPTFSKFYNAGGKVKANHRAEFTDTLRELLEYMESGALVEGCDVWAEYAVSRGEEAADCDESAADTGDLCDMIHAALARQRQHLVLDKFRSNGVKLSPERAQELESIECAMEAVDRLRGPDHIDFLTARAQALHDASKRYAENAEELLQKIADAVSEGLPRDVKTGSGNVTINNAFTIPLP